MHGVDVDVLYADEAVLVMDKPAGLLSVPGRGADKQDALSARVQRLYPDALVVHRLDMATSGLMLMARGLAVQRALGAAFESRSITKRYEAVVDGAWTQVPVAAHGWGLIDLPIRLDWPRRPLSIVDPVAGKPSQTRWQVLRTDTQAQTTRLALAPITGRSHQLRVHLSAIGHPILGDALYAGPAAQQRAGRLLLHARALGFVHPTRGEPLHFESPVPF